MRDKQNLFIVSKTSSKTQLNMAGFTNCYGKDNKVQILHKQYGVGVAHSIDDKYWQ